MDNGENIIPRPKKNWSKKPSKKIACDQLNGVYLNDTAGVQFTLYELRKELENRGHSMNFPNLVTSLEFISLSFWYDAPLISQDSDRRHHPWVVYGSASCSRARWSAWIARAGRAGREQQGRRCASGLA